MSVFLSDLVRVIADCAPGVTCGWYDGDGIPPLVIVGVVVFLILIGIWILLFRPRS